MSRIRGGLGVGVALVTLAAFSVPALASATPTLPDAAAGGVSHRAVCTPGPSGTARCHAHVVTGGAGVTPCASSTYPSGAYGTAQLRGAYGLTGASSTATVAIVDAFQNPNVVSDLAAYRSSTGLPACAVGTCFRVLNQSGGTSLSGVPGNTGWGQEIDLDVEMVSAVCPTCNIVLVEANSNYYSDLATAVSTAKGLSGVIAVSNSYGGGEWSGETSYNSTYSATSPQVVTVSSGDSGYGVEFPAAAPGVIAVGGTSLYVTSSNTRSSESAWSGAGSGCSAVEPQQS